MALKVTIFYTSFMLAREKRLMFTSTRQSLTSARRSSRKAEKQRYLTPSLHIIELGIVSVIIKQVTWRWWNY